MATLTIRNIEPDVLDRLKARARQNGRSLEAELRLILTGVSNRLTGKKAIDLADEIAAQTPKQAEQADSALLLQPPRITETAVTPETAEDREGGDWEFYLDSAKAWRWRRLDGEGRITGVSAIGYESRDDCVENALLTGYKK